MSENTLPRILIVDDEENSQHEVGLARLASTRARHPNDVEIEDLDWADLVLMDFVIDHWAEREELDAISLRPPNGLALAAVLREHADASTGDGHSYTAFAIHSAHIGDISTRLHTTNKTPQVVARLNNLEWAFDKANNSRFERSAELARAVRTVSKSWSNGTAGDVRSVAAQLLSISEDTDWTERAKNDVVMCQVPLSDFSAGTSGLLFLRWLLQGVLPYPTFLWSRHWVAARFRITPDSLNRILNGESQLACDLRECRYEGILNSFAGSRWWRSAIEQYAWGIRAGGAREPSEFHAELEKRAGCKLAPVDELSPVVCIDRELNPLDDLRPLDAVVRLVPDLWPAYADSAYAEVTAVCEDLGLRSIVHPLDRERVIFPGEDE